MDIKKLFFKILDISVENKYPDIHFVTWLKPYIRYHNWEIWSLDYYKDTIEKNGSIENVKIWIPNLSKDNISEIIKIVSWEEWLSKFKSDFELDVSYKYEDKDRYRINCYVDSNWYSIALRIIPSKIPSMDQLWLWDTIKDICNKNKWLVLVTWPTWSWKSTNLAAMIDYLNKSVKKHIITIEDPVEFSFKSNKSLINQREIWNHTKWFSEAIRASLREDPDIIMVWEMRDPETIRAALTLAETWHLVFSTLHTNDTVQSIDRIVDVFPAWQQEQIRMQLALSLVWIISQRLLPRVDNEWRIAAREILINNDAVKNLIITWQTHQIYSILEVSSRKWMILMDKYLTVLFKKKVISKEILMSYARDKEWIEMLID